MIQQALPLMSIQSTHDQLVYYFTCWSCTLACTSACFCKLTTGCLKASNLFCLCINLAGQVYDAKKGTFTELGMLDVQQIFGRAGRPQFDTSGEATIITTHSKLAHYLGKLDAICVMHTLIATACMMT